MNSAINAPAILWLDDEPERLVLEKYYIEEYFDAQGIEVRVDMVATIQDCISKLCEQQYIGFIVDLMIKQDVLANQDEQMWGGAATYAWLRLPERFHSGDALFLNYAIPNQIANHFAYESLSSEQKAILTINNQMPAIVISGTAQSIQKKDANGPSNDQEAFMRQVDKEAGILEAFKVLEKPVDADLLKLYITAFERHLPDMQEIV